MARIIKGWNRGKTLLTPNTRGWSRAKFQRNDAMEGIAIFSDFSAVDLGTSRKRVCTLEINHPDFELNRRLIEGAPEMYNAIEKMIAAADSGDTITALIGFVELRKLKKQIDGEDQ